MYAFTPLPLSLPQPQGTMIFSFCSGGELGFRLQHQFHISVDIWCKNEFHAAWMELKTYAYRNLQKDGFFTLFGMNQAGRRVFLYHHIRKELSEATRIFFDKNEKMIREGLIFQFEYETYIHQFIRWKPPIHSRRQKIWMDILGGRLHWIPFQQFRQNWRTNQKLLQDWYENPTHFQWNPCANIEPQITSQMKSSYSDIYLFEPSLDVLKQSQAKILPSGRIWIWTWRDLDKEISNCTKEISVPNVSPCIPPLFSIKKS